MIRLQSLTASKIFSALLGIIAGTIAVAATVAQASPAANLLGNCDYYQARSKELGCSDDGYLMSFGDPYCRSFVEANSSFTPDGQVVLTKIRLCLQEKLEERNDLTCDNVKQIAADSHVPCYTENHFCQMSWLDKLNLFKIVSPALTDPTLRQAVENIETECVREHLDDE